MPAASRSTIRSAAALTVLAGAVLALSGCAASGQTPQRNVEIRIAASAHPVDYEVQLAQAQGDFHSVHRMRTGQTRSFAVPVGWVVVRIPGLCVVPTASRGSGTTVVEVDSEACRLS